ncbi:MAG: dual specificity protein phosphatase family protein [Archangiaceae bacterium]|nr:dual specificity protein phosphatase family protein [Archangiaceae bacterium]
MNHYSLISFCAVALTVSACAFGPPFVQNIHTVVPGTVYRSAQLSGPRLTELAEERKIRSVINLRGAAPGERWYDEEVAAAKAAGLEHHDFMLSSREEVSRAQADELVAIMKAAPKPMLIHCWAGADRTGLASALYLYALAGEKPERAERALSMRYHHFSFTSAGAMDRSFNRYITAPDDLAPQGVAASP